MSTQHRAFRPLAATQSATPDGISASTVTFNFTLGTRAVRLCNIGTQAAFIRFREAGDSTAATAINGIPLPAGQTEIFTIGNDVLNMSVFSSAAGSVIYSTVGEGL